MGIQMHFMVNRAQANRPQRSRHKTCEIIDMTTMLQTYSSTEQMIKLTSEGLSGGGPKNTAPERGEGGGEPGVNTPHPRDRTRRQQIHRACGRVSLSFPCSTRRGDLVVGTALKNIYKQSKYINENKTQKESTKSIAIKFKSIKTDMENDHKLKISASRPTMGNLEI
jgi:hypothetical protein